MGSRTRSTGALADRRDLRYCAKAMDLTLDSFVAFLQEHKRCDRDLEILR